MTDGDILDDFFLVEALAELMGRPFIPSLCCEAVRELQTLAKDADSHPDDVMAAIKKLDVAIGGPNLVTVIAHDLWDDWCPQPEGIDPSQYNNDYGVVIWAGNRGYVKCLQGDDDRGGVTFTLSSCRL